MSVYLVDAVRTPFGRFGGGLSGIRTDDLAALPLAALLERYPEFDPGRIDDVVYGNTNGAGEENRNVARMALLLAGLPVTVPGATVNRLCGSGAEALVQACRSVAAGDADIVVAGGVESMSRAPFVLPRPTEPFPKSMTLHQTTVGWRMVNPRMPATWTESLGACVDHFAQKVGVSREEQDRWALRSHQRAVAAWEDGRFDATVVVVDDVKRDESLRPDTSLEQLGALPPAFLEGGTVTAGNSSPVNDGAMAALIASERGLRTLGVEPLARIAGSAVVGVEPDHLAVAPVPAMRRLADRASLALEDIDVVEINEAFAAVVACTLQELPELDAEQVNPNGGAIAIGHPLGASALRTAVDAAAELRRRRSGKALAAACIGVGQGIAVLLER